MIIYTVAFVPEAVLDTRNVNFLAGALEQQADQVSSSTMNITFNEFIDSVSRFIRGNPSGWQQMGKRAMDFHSAIPMVGFMSV